MKVECLNCGFKFDLTGASYDELGWHTVCPECEGSFDSDLPNYSERLQELFDYCRVTEIQFTDGYINIAYHCNTEANSKEFNTIESCMDCPKIGCHIHTTAQDAEMVLNSEKEIDDI